MTKSLENQARTASWPLSRWSVAFLIWAFLGSWSHPGVASRHQPEPKPTFDPELRVAAFEGFSGKLVSLRRCKEGCEQILENEPKHAEALGWHGAVLVWLAAQSFEEKQPLPAMMMLKPGLKELDDAIRLDPKNRYPRIARAGVLPKLAHAAPQPMAKALWEKARGDYQWLLDSPMPPWAAKSDHARGELLLGLALTERIVGERKSFEKPLERILKELPGTEYAARASQWLKAKPETSLVQQCLGCHK